MNKAAALLFILTFLTGCLGGYPLGMSEKEWLQLTPEQRIEARAKQSALDEIRQARLAEAARIEQERIDRLYAEAGPGDVLQCALEGGEVHFHTELGQPKPMAFRIARGEKKYIVLEQLGGIDRLQLWAEFDKNGLELNFCPSARDASFHSQCAMFVAIARDFAKGKSWRLDIKNIISGAALRCGFPVGKERRDKALPST